MSPGAGERLLVKTSCVIYRQILDWKIEFIDTLYIHFGTTGNRVLLLIYTLYSSPLQTHSGSQPSLVVSWQRIS
jgi:hypothetical protein